MKKTTALFVYLFGVVVAFSQSTEPYKYLGNYTQPAPNVASLGKFVDYPVSYYTGTPSISIPIYELQDGAAKASVSLSYHASGIRVAELSSWVGLGWALNAGGMITRSVRGGPDEGVFTASVPTGGYYKDSGIRKMPLLPYPTSGHFVESTQGIFMGGEYKEQLSAGFGDTEPDLFTFNFNGYSGKFVFDEFRTPRLLAHQDVRIQVTAGTSFDSWIITTPDGTKYFFGENNIREVNSIYSSTSGLDNNSSRPTSWLLTRIVYPNTKDTLYYEYAPETYSYFDLGQESKTYGYSTDGSSFRTVCNVTSEMPMNVYKTTVNGFRLTNIRSRNYRVSFGVNPSNVRQDLVNTGSLYPYMLDSVKIYNSQNQLIKQFVLGHSYFNSTTTTGVKPVMFSFTGSDVTDIKRLKLTSIRELSADGLTSKPPYNLLYEETFQLPRRLSYDIDHWGFSNNTSGNSNERFTPSVYHPICNYFTTGANRAPSWPAMQQFIIKNIQDPLGVVTAFEFEAHSSTSETPTSMVGGLRIKKITNTENLTGKTIVRNFSYDAGTLYKVPQYLFVPNNEFYYENGIYNGAASYRGYGFFSNLIFAAMRQSQSIVPLQDFQGNHIGYPFVKESFGLNGEGGYKLYSFHANQVAGNNSRLHMDNYTANVAVYHPQVNGGTYSGIFGNGNFNNISPGNLTYFTGYNVDDYYPAAPAQVEFRRGQLLREEIFDSLNNLISSTQNIYQQKYIDSNWIRGFKLHRVASSNDPESNTIGYHDAITFYKLRTGISQLTNTISTEYKDSKAFTTSISYHYESTKHINKTGDSTINSSGDTIVTKTYYSADYANTAVAGNVFGKMEKRNMILPVATRVWKNGQLVSGTITLFKDFAASAPDTFINPSKVYTLEVNAPMTPVAAGESVKLNGQFATLLPNASFKEQAVFNINPTTGKIIEQRLVTDKNQALIWDNNSSLPLAQTDNAMYTDVAYSSFETAEKGNWTYTGTPTTDATTRTGSKVYPAASGLSKTGITSAKKYILSYWYKGGTPTVTGGTQTNSFTGRVINGWTYRQVTITGTTSITIGGTGSIDEIRLHPEIAQMITYTYDALFRLIALNSPNNTVSFYEYDAMNRLVAIKDESGNVLKAFEYNYGASSR